MIFALKYFLCIFFFLAYERILYVNGIQEESVNFFCQSKHQLDFFLLTREAAEPEDRESMVYVREGKVKNDAKYEGRIKISGPPSLNTVNITLLNVKTTDAGLYNCMFIMREREILQMEQILILLQVQNKGRLM